MIRVKLMSIPVNDQNKARDFYTSVLGFVIKHDIPMGDANWLTLTAPDDPDGVELLLEPANGPAEPFQKAVFEADLPIGQLNTDDIQTDYARLVEKGVTFRSEPKVMGPWTYADFEDGCGNLIQLVQQ